MILKSISDCICTLQINHTLYEEPLSDRGSTRRVEGSSSLVVWLIDVERKFSYASTFMLETFCSPGNQLSERVMVGWLGLRE